MLILIAAKELHPKLKADGQLGSGHEQQLHGQRGGAAEM